MKKNKGKKVIKPVYHRWSAVSVLKASEGGPSQSYVRAMCKSLGFPVRFEYSPYVGQYVIEVPTRFYGKLRREVLNWS